MVQSESDDKHLTFAELIEIERKKAFEEGFEIGLKIGLKIVVKSTALTLLEDGYEVDYVAKLTKLTVAEVKQLKEA